MHWLQRHALIWQGIPLKHLLKDGRNKSFLLLFRCWLSNEQDSKLLPPIATCNYAFLGRGYLASFKEMVSCSDILALDGVAKTACQVLYTQPYAFTMI